MPEVNTIRDIVTPIAKEYGLKRIYLFGSYAKGTANEDSDIDLLIEAREEKCFVAFESNRTRTGSIYVPLRSAQS